MRVRLFRLFCGEPLCAYDQAGLDPFCELPVQERGSSFLVSTGFDGWPQRFSWMVGSGVHHGLLSMDHSSHRAEATSLINKFHMWQLERAEQAKDLGDPIDMVNIHDEWNSTRSRAF